MFSIEIIKIYNVYNCFKKLFFYNVKLVDLRKKIFIKILNIKKYILYKQYINNILKAIIHKKTIYQQKN